MLAEAGNRIGKAFCTKVSRQILKRMWKEDIYCTYDRCITKIVVWWKLSEKGVKRTMLHWTLPGNCRPKLPSIEKE